MQKNNEYFGIYINKKIPKTKDKENKNNYNKYNKNIKLEFEGKAFIINNKENEKIELKSGEKYKKEGKHTIKFINSNKEIYYIDIEIRKLYFIFLFLIAFFIICGTLFFSFNKNINTQYLMNETLNFDVDLEGIKYIFNINYENENFQSIKLTNNVRKKELIYPGSNGYINILISTKKGNKDMTYTMQVKEEKSKPKNLKFKVYGKTYNSMKELSQAINGNISKNTTEILKIEWFWDYENYNDIIDTNDGVNIENYNVLFKMVGTEKLI